MSKTEKMDYIQFKNELLHFFKKKLGEDANIEVRQILKNNAVYLDGLSILMPGENLSPTIYLKPYFELYTQELTFMETVERIEQAYISNRKESHIDVEFFRDFEQVKSRLAFKLINYEKNRELLQLVPHRIFLDFAIIYYCIVMDDSIGSATITVYNSHIEVWGVDEQAVYEAAKLNTPKLLPCILMEMTEIIQEAADETDIPNKEVVFGEQSVETCLLDNKNTGSYPRMFVLTNKSRTFGAVTMLYPNILRCFADKVKSDLYILPSSIHEIIIIAKCELGRVISLADMVREVNDEQVQEEEILSYNVYEYYREKNLLMMGGYSAEMSES